ncbi:MAG: SRPBCC family protein [Pseudonocardiaceae bacterium]
MSRYHFRNVWSVDMPAADVFTALADLDSYPAWWPYVRSVHQVDDDTADVLCRSVLPYSLELRLRRAIEDQPARHLRVDMSGDLEGFCAAQVERNGGGCFVRIAQEVVLRKKTLRRIEPVLRPLLRANHAAMMWRGERGLRAHLAGTSA